MKTTRDCHPLRAVLTEPAAKYQYRAKQNQPSEEKESDNLKCGDGESRGRGDGETECSTLKSQSIVASLKRPARLLITNSFNTKTNPISDPLCAGDKRSVPCSGSLPIIGLLLIVLFFCLLAHYSSIKIDWATTHDFTGSIQDVVQVLAFIAGGWWAYFKFIKGRTFQESLTPAVTGRFVSDGAKYLVATIQIKNVGASKIDFDREASALILYEYTPSSDTEIHAVVDKRLTSFAVYKEKDRYIEPSEGLEVQRFIAIPGPLKLAYRLEVEILSNSGFTWSAASIVDNLFKR